MLEFLKRDYNHEEFSVEYLGVNYRFSSNKDVKLYSFRVYPSYEGYKVKSPFIIYFNARDGYIHSLNHENSGYSFIKPDYEISTDIAITPADGLQLLDEEADYNFSETLIIKSKLSGKYVLVHMYKDNNREAYYSMPKKC